MAVTIVLVAEGAYRIKLCLDVRGHAAGSVFELYGVGESTMVGEPFAPKISVPRLLEHMFGGVIAGHPVRVRNLAERGVPLYPQLVAFERALAARTSAAPGVVIVMSGHNEGFMPDAGTRQRRYVPSFIANHFALVRDTLLVLQRRRWVGREHSLAAYEYYLRRVIELAQANGLVPILTTMASNIARIEPNIDASNIGSIGEVIAQGRRLEANGQRVQARDVYISNLTGSASPSMLLYRAGRCDEALGDFDAAREHYWAAVDGDPRLTFGRSTRRQNEVIRRLASEYAVPLVDGVRILEENSPHHLLGDELFMDGQHPTISGYLHLADAYARILGERFDTPVRHPFGDERDAATVLGFNDRDMSSALIDAGSWLIATSVGHPFPQDRMALAQKRFASALGKGDDFSAWFGVALAQAGSRGMLHDPDDVRRLGGLAGYAQSYSVPPNQLTLLLARFHDFSVDSQVIGRLKRTSLSSAASPDPR